MAVGKVRATTSLIAHATKDIMYPREVPLSPKGIMHPKGSAPLPPTLVILSVEFVYTLCYCLLSVTNIGAHMPFIQLLTYIPLLWLHSN